MIDAAEFEKLSGHVPRDDDLERANCASAGRLGHIVCGMCKHGACWECAECVAERFKKLHETSL
jgi:hypothetical protein